MTARLASWDARPGRTILIGRAGAQAGLFAVTSASVLVLSDASFASLAVIANLVALAVVAPSGAFQQHLARAGLAHGGGRSGVRPVALLNASLTVIAALCATALVGATWWALLVVVGGAFLARAAWSVTVLAVQRRFGAAALTELGGGFAMVVLTIGLVVASAGPVWWGAAYAIGAGVALFVGRWWERRQPTADLRPPGFAELLRGAVPLLLIGVLAMAFNRADLFILERMAPSSETASYALAGRLVGPLLIALGSLNSSLYPLLLDASATPEDRRRLCHHYSRRLVIACALLVPVCVLGAWAAGLLSGRIGDLDIVAPVLLLSLAVVPYAATISWGYLLIAVGAERVWLLALTTGLVVDIVAVGLFAHDSAVACAVVWLVVQSLLWLGIRVMRAGTAWFDRSPQPLGSPVLGGAA